jgi:hypothetical protein
VKKSVFRWCYSGDERRKLREELTGVAAAIFTSFYISPDEDFTLREITKSLKKL